MDMISENMAEDGLVFRDRYVGFGIMLDTELSADEGRMVVSEVIAESPVADILQPGDEFVSVGDVAVNADTIDRLPFRGKPGEAVAAVISRGGEEIPIEVSRGIVSTPTTKAEMLEPGWLARMMMTGALKSGSYMRQLVRATSSTYGHRRGIPTRATGLPFEAHQVTRMTFNEVGKSRIGISQSLRGPICS